MIFRDLAVKYLSWCERNTSPRTHEWYENYLTMFLAWPGVADTEVMGLKPYQVQEWIDSHGEKWGANYRGGAVVAVKRVYHWGEEQGYVSGNPIKKMKKPSSKRREIYMVKDDYETILSHLDASDPFRDLFLFVWHTGCRPQEVRHIEPRHVDLERERIVFPAEESKGKRSKRIIYMQGPALEVVKRLVEKHKEGKIFRNTRGEEWTKYAICNRFHRLSKIIGKRLFCYAARHGFGTRKLIDGHDHLTVAALMGHTDGSMLAKIYSHIADDDVHLKDALRD